MLENELRGEAYSKAAHNRLLQTLLNGRSPGAIEFKHANISAILIELGFPYLDGYKPRGNYQELLKEEVEAHLVRHERIAQTAQLVVEASVETSLDAAATKRALSDILVAAPIRKHIAPGLYERARTSRAPIRGMNYLEREARNSSLGAAGETFALEVEYRRLSEAGHRRLADRIEHVSRSKGDGLGYDIRSFEVDGRDRLIEVKTTGFGAFTPFFASKREVEVSEEQAAVFNLYRVFKFRDGPKLFVLPGALRKTCVLDAVQFRASVA
ncbi:MAG: DUF3883 domain-containing protein [Gemmatimonadetes bacterium]|nr:DUF3883 domain-containing protein [Gemmatimonadota bacterium]